MKIFMINSCTFGSTGSIMRKLAKVASNKGHEVVLCVPPSRSNAITEREKVLFIGNKVTRNLHVLFSLLTGFEGLGSILSTIIFIMRVNKYAPDIIHIHNLHGSYINYPIFFIYIKTKGIPLVWTLHDCWSITGHCSHFVNVKCDKWKTTCHNCPQKKSHPRSVLDTSRLNFKLKKTVFCGAKDTHVVSVSNWLRNVANDSYLKKHDNLTIYNGVDVEVFKPMPSVKSEKTVLIAVASSWNLSKGIYDYNKLSELLDSNKYDLLLVGVDDKTKKLLNAKINTHPKTKSVYDLVDLYNKSDIVLNLSHAETFGLTSIEGMACGKPCIVYDCTASPELVNRKTGIVVKEGDINGVINAISEIENNEDFAYKEECRKWVLENFNEGKQFEKYIQLYESVANKNQK